MHVWAQRSRRVRRRLAAAALLTAFTWFLRPAVAPANVQEQRARLPPPATDCSDPVTGTWMSHAFYPHVAQWYVIHLDVRRKAPGSRDLVGQMRVHFWTGDERTVEPPACTGDTVRAEVREPAVGAIASDGAIRFAATSYVGERTYCGWAGGYALDTFSGRIDFTRMEFVSRLDDGHEFRDIPVVFRRIACAEAPTVPRPVVAPPLTPPGHVSGCGLR
jgi:hypothetical protein